MLVLSLKTPLVSHAPVICVTNYFRNDLSGEAMCCIHSKVVEDYQKDLHPGAVLILRQVSSLSVVHVHGHVYMDLFMCMCALL